jgi:2-keto-4-pentenoate hydratase/2-oxohepta-3-ene-1,7-dioic acid hydratase in catechol pathway
MTFALAQFRQKGASNVRARLGAVIDGRLVDLTAADSHLTDLSALVAGGDAGLAHARQVAAKAAEVDQAHVEWLPPITKPGKIVCLGLNYAAHAAEGGNKAAEYPSFFLRVVSSLIGHRAPLIRPHASEHLDFEAELAVIVGRRARHLTVGNALDAVAGYSCFNDGSLRDYQRKTTQWTIGKNFDGTGAFGPWFVPASELPVGAKGLKIESRLNGQVMQSDNTGNMIVPVAETMQLLTEVMTLEPGDVIIMGTPAGVGYARKPPVWMKPGDTIEIDIEGVGVLSNPVVDEVRA